MEEQNAKVIEVKSHKREVRKPVMRKDLPLKRHTSTLMELTLTSMPR